MPYTVTRTFHPVGQGACYSELFSEGDTQFLLVFYDFGTSQQIRDDGSNVFDVILQNYSVNIPVSVFISHFHQDHINGLPKLMNHFRQVKLFYPQLTFELLLETFVTDPDIAIKPIDSDYADLLEYLAHPRAQSNDVQIETVFQYHGAYAIVDSPISVKILKDADSCSDNPCDWVYIPYIIDHAKSQTFSQWFKTEYLPDAEDKPISVRELYSLVKENIEKCVDKYKEIWGDLNHSSMPVMSSNVTKIFPPATNACLYTGDLIINGKICHDFPKNFKQFWRRLKILQVPHHGSKYNSKSKQLFRPHLLCVISAGLSHHLGHPDIEILNELTVHGSVPLLVTENPKSEKTFIYNL